jgi:hypothetical protein
MTGHTAKGYPYALGSDAVTDWPATSLELAAKLDSMRVISHTEFTAPVAVSSGSAAGANTVVTAPAFTADGATPYMFEFFAPTANPASAISAQLFVTLWDGAVDLGTWGWLVDPAGAPGLLAAPLMLKRRLTPAAGVHTYSVRAWQQFGAASVSGGTGGIGKTVPGYFSIVRAP